ncbi:hypothetical protein BN1723_020110, partial [Verticillium longisporum]
VRDAAQGHAGAGRDGQAHAGTARVLRLGAGEPAQPLVDWRVHQGCGEPHGQDGD